MAKVLGLRRSEFPAAHFYGMGDDAGDVYEWLCENVRQKYVEEFHKDPDEIIRAFREWSPKEQMERYPNKIALTKEMLCTTEADIDVFEVTQELRRAAYASSEQRWRLITNDTENPFRILVEEEHDLWFRFEVAKSEAPAGLQGLSERAAGYIDWKDYAVRIIDNRGCVKLNME